MFDTDAWKNTVGEFGTELKEMQEDICRAPAKY